ncbi:MAG: DinB family protein [Bacteroidota bacterium]
MTDLLSSYAAHYDASRSDLHRIADGLSDEAFNWKPSPRSWSVGECVVHLNTIAKGYLPELERLASADAPRGDAPFRYGWLAGRFIGAVSPGSRAIPTGGPMKPPKTSGERSEIDQARALSSFDGYTDRYLAVCDDASGLDLQAIQMRSPFLKLMKLPLGAFIEALGLHAVRHVQQAERVTQRPGFPG